MLGGIEPLQMLLQTPSLVHKKQKLRFSQISYFAKAGNTSAFYNPTKQNGGTVHQH
jgi:hypothetical protein